MKLNAYSLRDCKAETFAAPFFTVNDNLAIRLLNELVLDTRSNLGKYPADFMLYRIGSYDSDNAELTPERIELVCSASSCLPKPDPRQLTLDQAVRNGEKSLAAAPSIHGDL